jgi:hypothetical protein
MCANWKTSDVNNALLHYQAPPHYPVEETDPHGKLKPIELCNEGLKNAVTLSIDRLKSIMWSKKIWKHI